MSSSRLRRFLVWFGAAVTCLIGVLTAFLGWAVGLGQYLEDYCFTNVGSDIPAGGRGPFIEWPVTLRCEYDGFPDIVVTDWAPLLWSIGWAAAALAGVGAVLLVARRLATRA